MDAYLDKFIISANQSLKLKIFTAKGAQEQAQLDEKYKYFTLPNLAKETSKDRIQQIDVVALMNDEETL